jgi:O-methyltransferase
MIKNYLSHCILRFFNLLGYKISKNSTSNTQIAMTPENLRIYESVRPYTMTSPERVNALLDAVQYVVKNNIDGAFVECGVWRGGSAMAVALKLKSLGVSNRNIFLYDTFSGMPAPGDSDVSNGGDAAIDTFERMKVTEDTSEWCYSSLSEVRDNLAATGYPIERMHFVEGKVEETLPAVSPKNIALLRLDTDWYASTKHELENLYPLLMRHGILIIDDYGHWRGAQMAVDEYIFEHELKIYLNRVDDTGRLAIKV